MIRDPFVCRALMRRQMCVSEVTSHDRSFTAALISALNASYTYETAVTTVVALL